MSERWDGGTAYERFMGRWSRLAAGEFVDWLGLAADRAWLDVGCGTGALLDAIAAAASPRRLAGIDPSAAFLEVAAARLPTANLRVADAQQLPFEPAEFDAVVSGLVLNFVPDPLAAVREMRRVARPGGTVGVYVWDYAEGMEFLRHFWDAAAELGVADAQDEGRRFAICRPDALADLFAAAGMTRLRAGAVEIRTHFASFDDYWQPFFAGQGPAGALVTGLAPARADALAELLRLRLPAGSDGSIDLGARAWAIAGS